MDAKAIFLPDRSGQIHLVPQYQANEIFSGISMAAKKARITPRSLSNRGLKWVITHSDFNSQMVTIQESIATTSYEKWTGNEAIVFYSRSYL